MFFPECRRLSSRSMTKSFPSTSSPRAGPTPGGWEGKKKIKKEKIKRQNKIRQKKLPTPPWEKKIRMENYFRTNHNKGALRDAVQSAQGGGEGRKEPEEGRKGAGPPPLR